AEGRNPQGLTSHVADRDGPPLGSPVSRGRRPSVPIQGSNWIGSGRARRQGSRHPSAAATENNPAGPPVRLPASGVKAGAHGVPTRYQEEETWQSSPCASSSRAAS